MLFLPLNLKGPRFQNTLERISRLVFFFLNGYLSKTSGLHLGIVFGHVDMGLKILKPEEKVAPKKNMLIH